MSMKVLVVDDEKLARERLMRMLSELRDVTLVGEAQHGQQALELCSQVAPDVVLMDIRMPGMDGLEAARHLATMQPAPAVVFCTAYEEHAVQAFNVQAVGYLLKPVRRGELEAALQGARRLNRAQIASLVPEEKRRRSQVAARTHRGLELIAVQEIRYFLADQKYVTVRHGGGEVLIDESLRDLETEFAGDFVRVHRNALVNSIHVEALERSIEGQYRVRLRGLTDALDVSRRHVTEVRRFLESI